MNKKIENKLRESEAELRALFAGLPDVIMLLDIEGRYLKIAPTKQELLYMPEDELKGKCLHDTFAKEQADIFLSHIQNSLKEQKVVELEYSLNISREELWFAGRIVPMSENKVIYVARDITSEKKAEDTLKKSEEKYRAIFENATDIIIVAQNGKIAFANPAFEKIMNYSRNEIVSKPFIEFIHPDDRQMVFERYKKRMAGQDIETGYQFRVLTKSGDIKWVLINSSKLDWDGKPSTLNFLTDVTEKRNNEELVIKAKEQAESANRAKSNFLANMSHELRTPLNSILGYAQILKRDKNITAKQKESLETIHYSSEHLLKLINELLDLSRIESQKMELEKADVYLPSFLKGIIEISKIRAQQENVSFEFEIQPDLPTGVNMDEKRLRQVLLNLINNAIKFSRKGSVKFRISTNLFNEKDSIARFRCEVSDTGIGIPPEELKNIFLPFHQVNKSQLKTEGTGLGLPISRNLLNIMGSELYVESILGKGSKFWFDLELHVVKNLTETSQISTEIKDDQIIGYEGNKRKILIADDNNENRSLLRDILSPLGFDIREAVNGKEAVEIVKLFNPDLILMDLVMPLMNGIAATQEIRKMSSINKVVVIGVSASALEEKRQISLNAGCDDFLSKPIHINELLECLKSYLGLDWVYDEPILEIASEEVTNNLQFIFPKNDVVNDLMELAEINHITGIQQTLEKLKKFDKQFLPFSRKIEGLLKNFEFDQIIKILKSHLQGNT